MRAPTFYLWGLRDERVSSSVLWSPGPEHTPQTAARFLWHRAEDLALLGLTVSCGHATPEALQAFLG